MKKLTAKQYDMIINKINEIRQNLCDYYENEYVIETDLSLRTIKMIESNSKMQGMQDLMKKIVEELYWEVE